jgi:gamma-glutamyltranspeptidase / glutathione hydrolase
MHVQLTVRLRDHGQNLQAAIDAPRWHLDEHATIVVEPEVGPPVVDRLRGLGHDVRVDDPAAPAFFGGAQMAWHLPAGGYAAASDGRREGLAVGF